MNKLVREKAKILNIGVDSTSRARVLRFLRLNLEKWAKNQRKGKGLFVVTPNPEQVVCAQTDEEFAKIINSADIAVPDAIGLVLANCFLNLPNPKNKFVRAPLLFGQGLFVGFSTLFNKESPKREFSVIKGRKMFVDLVKLANKNNWRVYLLGGEGDASKKAARVLKRKYKKVVIKCTGGPKLDIVGTPVSEQDREIEKNIVSEINRFKPHLLFVGFGAPKQEKWTYRQLRKLNVGCAMVVGGTFDYVSGMVKIPPRSFERLGLEWLWRLFTQPRRFKRIIIATVVFPARMFVTKLTDK
jgi:N-acetylglucosaminyldiphosphoundecaprenol N-acetyl-beta-D-mannosaminyltransferase